MPDSDFFLDVTVDEELVPGARNAVRTCLDVKPEDRVVFVADEASKEVAAAIFSELRRTGAETKCFVLERYGRRPIEVTPREIIDAYRGATVSLMVVAPQPGELKTRTTVLDIARERKIRHAHMPGIDRRLMVTGMRADYRRVARLQERLLKRLGPESIVKVRTPAGTDLEVRFSDRYRWVRCDGLIQPGVVQNLPAGQLFTTPETVEGVFVGDGAIGEWFGMRYPDLASYPLTVEISQGRVLDARSSNAPLARQFLLYVRSNPGGDRVGEFAIGTNLALDGFLGNALQDETVPGVHLAFGGAAVLAATGATWTCKTHLPLITRDCDIEVDGQLIMRSGRFIDDLLGD